MTVVVWNRSSSFRDVEPAQLDQLLGACSLRWHGAGHIAVGALVDLLRALANDPLRRCDNC